MNKNGLLQLTDSGLYCAAGDFYVDPWRTVQRAIITHAHGDHAYRGHARYLIASPGLRVFRTRLGPDATIYTLGKAQRLIAGVDASIGPIYTHGAVEHINRDYRESGIDLPATTYVGAAEKADWTRALIVAPPSAHATPWTRKFGTVSTGFAS